MVHHDFALGRLTLGSRQLAAMTAAGLKDVPFKGTADRMMTLGELCDFVGGRVPLVIELKSRFDGDLALVPRAAAVLKTYAGPAVLMSFDPAPIAALREIAPGLPRGIVAERHYADSEWAELDAQPEALARIPHARAPHAAAFHRLPRDGPALALARWIARNMLAPAAARPGRCAATRTGPAPARWADQMIFEGFRP